LGAAADNEMVKKFKKLLKALHPDRGGDERHFKVFFDHY
jgi:curved DNA-binding protein CbpA